MTETISTTESGTSREESIDRTLSFLQGKKVIADTSSLLMAGVRILDDLPECELVIPSVVLLELEEKRTHSTLGFLARQWLRLIDRMRSDARDGRTLREGVPVPDNEYVSLRVEQNHTSQDSLPGYLRDGSNDKTILAVAVNFRNEESENKFSGDVDGHDAGVGSGNSLSNVVLLSNDTPMKIYADLDLGLPAVGYDRSAVNKVQPFSGVIDVVVSEDEAQSIFSRTEKREYSNGIPEDVVQKIRSSSDKTAHFVARLVLPNGNRLLELLVTPDEIDDVDYNHAPFGIEGRTIEQVVALNYLQADVDDIAVCSLSGKAGTGKTLLALAAGIDGVENKGAYEKVLVFRSLHEMGQGQEMGFLPGDKEDKIRPWAGAVYDALSAIASQTRKKKQNTSSVAYTTDDPVEKYKEIVEVSPVTYLRGRSLSNAYIVIEEAQNFSFSELLNILSRVGQGSKVVLTFDAAQVDNKFLSAGNRADVWAVVDKLKSSDVFAHIGLQRTERSKVADIASRVLEGGN